jgi:predicted nucleic acid-binding protein
MSEVAVDTNILIYLHEEITTFETDKANKIVRDLPVISAQVISEYLNVL